MFYLMTVSAVPLFIYGLLHALGWSSDPLMLSWMCHIILIVLGSISGRASFLPSRTQSEAPYFCQCTWPRSSSHMHSSSVSDSPFIKKIIIYSDSIGSLSDPHCPYLARTGPHCERRAWPSFRRISATFSVVVFAPLRLSLLRLVKSWLSYVYLSIF